MAESHVVRVKIEGESNSLDQAATRAAQSTKKVTHAVTETSKAHQKAAEAVKKQGDAVSKLPGLLGKLNAAATAATGNTLSFGRSIANVASAFGPWGLAVSVAGNVLLDFAESERVAAEEARKAKRAIDDQRRALEDLRAAKALERVQTSIDARILDRETAATREQIRELENLAAINRGSGGNNAGVERELARLRADELRIKSGLVRIDGDIADAETRARFEAEKQALLSEADAIMREQELRDLEEQYRVEKKITKEKQFRWDAELLNASRMGRNMRGITREGADTREFEAARIAANNARVGSQIQRMGPIETAALQSSADAQLNEQMRAIEMSSATGGMTELERIDAVEQAQLQHIATLEQVAGAEAMVEEKRQIQHDAEMARIAEGNAARQRARDMAVTAAETTATVIGAASKIGVMAAEASGKSAEKRARAAQIGAGIESMAIGALEVVKAAAAYASLNIPQGIAHTAAAAVAFTQGGLLLSGRIGGPGGGASPPSVSSSSSSSSAGGGSGSTPSVPGSDSQIPGSPGPQAPSAGGSGAGSGGGAVILDLRGANFYGTGGRKEFSRFVDEALEEGGHNRRQRRDPR